MKKKHVFRKLTLTRETLSHLDPSRLPKKVAGGELEPIVNPWLRLTRLDCLNTRMGTSCGLCSDFIYCGPSADCTILTQP